MSKDLIEAFEKGASRQVLEELARKGADIQAKGRVRECVCGVV